MEVGSIVSPRQREKPRIFSNYNNSPNMNTSTNNSQLETVLNSSLKPNESLNFTKEFSNELPQEARPVSTKLPETYELPQSQLDKSIEINILKIENKNLKEENQKINETVNKLRKELTEKVTTLQKFNELMKIKYAEIKALKTEIETKNQTISSYENQKLAEKEQSNNIKSQEVQKLKEQYILKSTQLDQLLTKINNLEHENFTNEVFQMKVSKLYDELEEEKTKSNSLLIERSELNQKINELKEKVETLEYENKKIQTINKIEYQSEQIENLFVSLNETSSINSASSSPIKQSKQSQHLNAFEEALKVQLKQIEELKKTIENSQEIIQSLKDNLITSRREIEELRAEMKIISLKETTERKKLIMEYRLQLHEKDNEINNSFKKYKTLDEKYKTALNDIKAKDDFLRQHLLGRLTDITTQEYVDSVLKKYTENFEQLVDLKTQNAELTQKSEKYLKYEMEIENGLLENQTKE